MADETAKRGALAAAKATITAIPQSVIDRVRRGIGGFKEAFSAGTGAPTQQVPPDAGFGAFTETYRPPGSPAAATAATTVSTVQTDPPPEPPPGPQPMVAPADRSAWNGPMWPVTPVAPRVSVAGRVLDYDIGYNQGFGPKRTEGVPYRQLTDLIENCNLVELAIETRLDQMAALKWSVVKVKAPNQQVRDKPDERCAMIESAFRRPDRRDPFINWTRRLLFAVLAHDAPAIYVHRDRAGRPYSFDIIDGTTIDVKIDERGRTPLPPRIAYQQILKGSPAVNYTTEELLFWPRNRRPGRLYGRSPVEQIILTINIALGRDLSKIKEFTDGNIPNSLVAVPPEWTAAQIAEFQTYWDAMTADSAVKRQMKFVPGGMNVQFTRAESALADGTDEWFARVICWAFSLPPTALVRMMNRATAESAYDAALTEGLQPLIEWQKSLFDHIVQHIYGFEDLEMVPDDIRNVDPLEQQGHDMTAVDRGLMAYDEWRVKAGLDPVGMDEPFIRGIGPMGGMFVSDLLWARKQGLLRPVPPPPPDMMGGMPMGPPSALPPPDAAVPQIGPPGLAPGAAEVLNGVSPDLLAAVGLGPDGTDGRSIDIMESDARASDPRASVVADPKILEVLRSAEQRLGKRAPPPARRRRVRS